MSEDKSISMFNLGDLSKPADTLIKKVSVAIGGMFEPWQIRRVAKAKAEADLIKVRSEIEITDLHRRAMRRFVEEEASRQENMESITVRSLPLLGENSDPSRMDDDWVTNFFDKARIVSDQEMQDLWAKVLAGEANAPGTYSKRTVNALGDLDKKDAELLQALCGFGWRINKKFAPLVFELQHEVYTKQGITFESLTHLDSIGLINFSNISGYTFNGVPKTLIVSYYDQPLQVTMEREKDNKLPIGHAILTKIGNELSSVCRKRGVKGFFDYVKGQWKQYICEDDRSSAPNENY